MLAYVAAHRAFFAIASEQGLFAGTAAPGARATAQAPRVTSSACAPSSAPWSRRASPPAISSPSQGDALVRFFGGTIRAFVLSGIADRATNVDEDAAMVVELFLHGAARRKKPRERPKIAR